MYFKSIKKIYQILNVKEKLIVSIFFISTFFSIIIETISIGTIIPIVSIINESNFTTGIQFLDERIFLKFNSLDLKNKIYLIVKLLLILFSIRFFIQILILKIRVNFIFTVTAGLQKRLMYKFMHLKWLDYSGHGTKLIRNIQSDTGLFKSTVLGPIMDLISEILLFSLIISFLIIYNPNVTFAALFLFSIVIFLINLFSKHRLKKLSNKRTSILDNQVKIIYEIINNIKDITINFKKKFYYNKFITFNEKNLNISKEYTLLTAIPRPIIEFSMIILLCLLILFAYYFSYNNIEILKILGLFVAATYKLGPSASKILIATQSFRLGKIILGNIHNELKDFDLEKKSLFKNIIKKKFLRKIEFKNVSFFYPKNKKKLILDKINLSIKKYSKIGIIGLSGEGKSTLVDMIAGLIEPNQGKIYIDGKDKNLSEVDWRKNVNYVSQSTSLFDDSIKNNIIFEKKLSFKGKAKLKKIIKICLLEKFIESKPEKLETNLGELNSKQISGGEKQRLLIARALFSNPEILILDESINALDPETSSKIINNLKKLCKKLTIIFISHNYKHLTLCENIYKLQGRKLKKIK